jgi:hypothetical protein
MATGTTEKPRHTKGQLTPGKKVVNWRLLIGVLKMLAFEAERLGYSSVPEFVNAFFTEYFNNDPGEWIQRKP